MGMTVAVGQYEVEPLIVNSDQVPELAESVNYGKGEVREEEPKFSSRLWAQPYPLESKHVRIAQPWDLKRGLEHDVLKELARPRFSWLLGFPL